ncbi:hypothetical protein WSK_4132 [Novosphingobium sp. Rr 2-17]|nr:hypothetical protein WSK_4132 [Novosphingobium sp. Rr 2-17]
MLPLLALTLTVANPEVTAICPGTTTPDVNACRKFKFDQADADLNKYYKAALNRLQKDNEPEAIQSLIRAQRAWMSYSDAECGLFLIIGAAVRSASAWSLIVKHD